MAWESVSGGDCGFAKASGNGGSLFWEPASDLLVTSSGGALSVIEGHLMRPNRVAGMVGTDEVSNDGSGWSWETPCVLAQGGAVMAVEVSQSGATLKRRPRVFVRQPVLDLWQEWALGGDHLLPPQFDGVWATACGPSGKILAIAHSEGVSIFNLEFHRNTATVVLKKIHTSLDHVECVSLAFASSHTLICGLLSEGGDISVLNIHNPCADPMLLKLNLFGSTQELAVSADRTRLAAACGHAIALVHITASGEWSVHSVFPQAHQRRLTGIGFDWLDRVVSASEMGDVKLWTAARDRLLPEDTHEWPAKPGTTCSRMTVSPNGAVLVVETLLASDEMLQNALAQKEWVTIRIPAPQSAYDQYFATMMDRPHLWERSWNDSLLVFRGSEEEMEEQLDLAASEHTSAQVRARTCALMHLAKGTDLSVMFSSPFCHDLLRERVSLLVEFAQSDDSPELSEKDGSFVNQLEEMMTGRGPAGQCPTCLDEIPLTTWDHCWRTKCSKGHMAERCCLSSRILTNFFGTFRCETCTAPYEVEGLRLEFLDGGGPRSHLLRSCTFCARRLWPV